MSKHSKIIRHFKLQPKHRSMSYKASRVVPSLTLSGAWQEDMGFKPGAMVTITIEQDQQIIKSHQL